jgi:hypothetical protein
MTNGRSKNGSTCIFQLIQADSVVQKSGTINIHGGNYPDRANEVIRLFREIQAMAMVFPQCPAIDMLCAATSGFVDDPAEMLNKQRLKNLMDAMNDVREKALVDSSVLKRVIK